MSLHLFSLSDEEVFKRNATLLMLAFSRPMDDPNHMPATRDLSESKRQAVLDWLGQFTREEPPRVAATSAAGTVNISTDDVSGLAKPHAPSIERLEGLLAGTDGEDMGGKTSVMRNYLESEIDRLKQEG